MFKQVLTYVAIFLLAFSVLAEDSFAKSGRSSFGGSSRSSFGSSSSRSSYSRPSSSSKPKYSSGSTSSSKPKYSSGSGSSTSSSKPKYGSGSTSSKPKYSAPAKKAYVPTKTATSPPKSSYTTSTGKTVKVNSSSSAVKSIRSRPSTDYTPAARTQRTEVHITTMGYAHPYSYYNSYQPFYVGGGYSSSFWWMMAEWNAERRARWLYHNQGNIDQSAYERGMKDAAVAAEIARLKTEGTAQNGDYIDSEFEKNPDLMYDQDYVEAAYNPTVAPKKNGFATFMKWVLTLIVIGAIGYGVYYFVAKARF